MEYYIHIYILQSKCVCVCVCVHTHTHIISWSFKYSYSTSCSVELAVGQQDWGHQSPRIQCQAQPAWNNLHPHGCCIGIQCPQCRVWPKATKALIYTIIKMNTHYITCKFYWVWPRILPTTSLVKNIKYIVTMELNIKLTMIRFQHFVYCRSISKVSMISMINFSLSYIRCPLWW